MSSSDHPLRVCVHAPAYLSLVWNKTSECCWVLSSVLRDRAEMKGFKATALPPTSTTTTSTTRVFAGALCQLLYIYFLTHLILRIIAGAKYHQRIFQIGKTKVKRLSNLIQVTQAAGHSWDSHLGLPDSTTALLTHSTNTPET